MKKSIDISNTQYVGLSVEIAMMIFNDIFAV